MMERIGRYEILEHIGAGAMADIYRARDPEIDRVVAVKVLKNSLNDDDDIERFLREARAAGALTHPNIVTIFDVGQVDGTPYITMELLEGVTLEDLMAGGRTMSDRDVIEVAMDIASALQYAHERGVVHRDIKPSNILFMPGTRRQPKIADFGIAHLETTESTATLTGAVIGTPRYMSPEQALGENIDGRSDLFSLGVILFEMLTNERAFDAATSTSLLPLLLQITQAEPRTFKEVETDVPTGLQQIVTKLLAKKPERRFQSGAELHTALEKERETAIEREADAQRNKYIPLRLKWAATTGVIIAIVLGLSIYTVVSIQAEEIRRQTLDSGASLAKFIATEAAIPVLSEDWIRLETFVTDARARDTFQYLIVKDHNGTVRATTDAELDVAGNETLEAVREMDGIGVSSLTVLDEAEEELEVFDFDTPILFQDTRVGAINLGLSREGLNDVMDITRTLMGVLALITLAAVVGMLYVFGGLLTRPLRMLTQSMDIFSSGDWDHRASSVRNDEIGHLFAAFNSMAEAVQARVGAPPDAELEEKAEPQAEPDPNATVDLQPGNEGRKE